MGRIQKIRATYDPDAPCEINTETGEIRQRTTGLRCSLFEFTQATKNMSKAEALLWIREVTGKNLGLDQIEGPLKG